MLTTMRQGLANSFMLVGRGSYNILRQQKRSDSVGSMMLRTFNFFGTQAAFGMANLLDTAGTIKSKFGQARTDELHQAAVKRIIGAEYNYFSREHVHSYDRGSKNEFWGLHFSAEELDAYIDENFAEIWRDAQITYFPGNPAYANRKGLIHVMANHAVRSAKDHTNGYEISEIVSGLMQEPNPMNISTHEVLKEAKVISQEKTDALKSLAFKAIFDYGHINLNNLSYDQILEEMKGTCAHEYVSNRYGFTQEEILDYAIANAEQITEYYFHPLSNIQRQETIANMKRLLQPQRGVHDSLGEDDPKMHYI